MHILGQIFFIRANSITGMSYWRKQENPEETQVQTERIVLLLVSKVKMLPCGTENVYLK